MRVILALVGGLVLFGCQGGRAVQDEQVVPVDVVEQEATPQTKEQDPGVLVLDEHGDPVGGATVHVVLGHWRHKEIGTTDEDGWSALPPSKRDRMVTAYSGDAAFADLVDVPPGPLEQTIKLVLGPPAGRIVGLVVDNAGQPVPGARVRLEMLTDGSAGSYRSYGRPSLALSTDRDGKFQADGVPEGPLPIRVEAYSTGLAPCRHTVDIVAGASIETTIRLTSGARLVGSVLDADGKAVTCRVHLSSDSFYTFFAPDKTGRFSYPELPRETVRVYIQPWGESRFTPVERNVDASAGDEIDLPVKVTLRR